jgi:hypothetical protein
MKMLYKLFLVLVFAALASAAAKADAVPTLTLDPSSGNINGAAGSTVGWGFTLENLGPYFAVVSSSDFCVGPITSPCSNSFGTYTDFIAAQFLVVGPSPENSSISQSFDDAAQLGLGSFFINATSTGSVLGQLVLTYDLYSVDPFSQDFDPTVDTVSNGNFLKANASVTVGTGGNSTVPEPNAAFLLAVGAGLTLMAKKRA